MPPDPSLDVLTTGFLHVATQIILTLVNNYKKIFVMVVLHFFIKGVQELGCLASNVMALNITFAQAV